MPSTQAFLSSVRSSLWWMTDSLYVCEYGGCIVHRKINRSEERFALSPALMIVSVIVSFYIFITRSPVLQAWYSLVISSLSFWSVLGQQTQEHKEGLVFTQWNKIPLMCALANRMHHSRGRPSRPETLYSTYKQPANCSAETGTRSKLTSSNSWCVHQLHAPSDLSA